MKQVLCFLAFFAFSHSTFATILTVCNMPYTPGQFTTMNAALAASAASDTIYVHGSTTSYGNIMIITNDLVIIGAGHNPSDKQSPMPSTFGTIEVWASNVQLIGLALDHVFAFSNSTGTIIKRCRIAGSNSAPGININAEADNWLIEGNIFVLNSYNVNISFNFRETSNTRISNNILNGYISGNAPSTPTGSFTINNNIFLPNGGSSPCFEIYNASIVNNILVGTPPSFGTHNSTWNHNISFNAVPSNFPAGGVGNLEDVDPMFMSYPGFAQFSYAHDYRLAPGSPGIDNGFDGTDRGVYGGFGNKFSMTGQPAMAEITAFTITSPTTIAPGGTLTISVTSKRVD
jgi:hypothetical protein